MFYKGTINIASVEQLKKLKTGIYYVTSVTSQENFFSSLEQRSFLMLQKIRDSGDMWIKFTTAELIYYHGFFNSNGAVHNLEKVF